MVKLFVNSGDPDQTPRAAASDFGSGLFANYPFTGLPTTMGQVNSESTRETHELALHALMKH